MATLLSEIREICRLLEIKPARSKGQNFLINERIYQRIVAEADLKDDETVLEVGPGLGFLTLALAAQAKRVLAVELDDRLAQYLQSGVAAANLSNIQIFNEDILKFNLAKQLLPGESYKIVANLPYNITAIFLRMFLSAPQQPQLLVLMLQKEVAERLIAQPPKMNLLALSVQYYAKVTIVREVKAGNFWPEPQVDSAIVKLEVKEGARDLEEEKLFFRLLRSGFSAKRKMLKNNLANSLKISGDLVKTALENSKLDLSLRAEQLSLADWQRLLAELRDFML